MPITRKPRKTKTAVVTPTKQNEPLYDRERDGPLTTSKVADLFPGIPMDAKAAAEVAAGHRDTTVSDECVSIIYTAISDAARHGLTAITVDLIGPYFFNSIPVYDALFRKGYRVELVHPYQGRYQIANKKATRLAAEDKVTYTVSW